MNEQFRLGEVVTVVWLAGTIDELARSQIGQEGTITALERVYDPGVYPQYQVRMQSGALVYASWHNLRKRKPPEQYDGNQVTKWLDCPWQPERVT